jgi:predicted GH43/DUF377 family glycosyl hydrolase
MGISSPSVIKFGNTYFMAYTGTNGFVWRIGLAYSIDKVSWTKHPSNPIFSQGGFGEWDSQGVWDPHVLYDESELKMYYTGFNGSDTNIGLATSTNGLSWTRVPENPILEGLGITGVIDPYVINDGSQYMMWYSGYNSWSNFPFYKIELALSFDGLEWTKADSINPVLNFGEQTFENSAVFGSSVILKETFKLWYTGRNGYDTKIGFALSRPLFIDVSPFSNQVVPGNFLDYSTMVRNTSSDSVPFQMWTDATLSNGNPYPRNPVLGPDDLEAEPNETLSGILSIYIPDYAPPDSGYRVTTKIGAYPNEIWDISGFEFEILDSIAP